MRKSFLIFLAIIIFATSDVYFIRTGSTSDSDEILQIQKLLDEIEYPHPYKFGVFDCSNQTAFLYDYFTSRGFKCEIMVGWHSFGGWHAWLIIIKNGKEFWVEATMKQILSPSDYEDYFFKFRFRSLKFLQFFSKIFFLPNEWTY